MPKFIDVGSSSISLSTIERVDVDEFGDEWKMEVYLNNTAINRGNFYEKFDTKEKAEKRRQEIVALLNAQE